MLDLDATYFFQPAFTPYGVLYNELLTRVTDYDSDYFFESAEENVLLELLREQMNVVCISRASSPVGVNIEPRLLKHRSTFHILLRGLKSGDYIEITERGYDSLDSSSLNNLQLISDAGIKLVLDDITLSNFDNGLLNQMNLSFVKLDKHEFWSAIKSDSVLEHLHRLVNLLTKHDCSLIVEGIESLEQLIICKKSGVYAHQGFYLSRPLNAKTNIYNKASYLPFFNCE
ncbi:EAL domain-containing protein [Vibrio sp. McD22-P3]|uniref:EAL domain-containing protein n=1 Tax=Vibrio sp. McD22-P3 TaxID=2724880 RepID=UPI001F395EAE|nr:EAL domain-containing protein [Vibrio sp. McD22-P3]MCF4176147.1 EAL domain-containing protein [Vibrio sp. McD22-P3]